MFDTDFMKLIHGQIIKMFIYFLNEKPYALKIIRLFKMYIITENALFIDLGRKVLLNIHQ